MANNLSIGKRVETKLRKDSFALRIFSLGGAKNQECNAVVVPSFFYGLGMGNWNCMCSLLERDVSYDRESFESFTFCADRSRE